MCFAPQTAGSYPVLLSSGPYGKDIPFELHWPYEYARAGEKSPYSGSADRLRAIAPDGVHAFVDTFGHANVDLAIDLGVPAHRINTLIDHDVVDAGHHDGGTEEIEVVPPQIVATPGMPERQAVGRRQSRVREIMHTLPPKAQAAIRDDLEGTHNYHGNDLVDEGATARHYAGDDVAALG
jgi:hypothetical protein